MDKQLAIIIPTIHRDELLLKTLKSIFKVWDSSWHVIVIDQNKESDHLPEKIKFYNEHSSNCLKVAYSYYDIGISACRNYGIELALENNIPYCLISADSIEFTENMRWLGELDSFLEAGSFLNANLIGLNLKNRKVGWEANLKLIENQYFELDFIDKYTDIDWVNCDIVRNFFIAETDTLNAVRWDENLKTFEHEDFFWRYKQAGYKVGWTCLVSGNYIGTREGLYGNLREKNMQTYMQVLKKKYNLKGWVQYKHLERAKEH